MRVASAQPAAEAVALTHATVIDGTGAAPMADSLVLVRGGRIAAVYSAGSRPVPDGARVEDLTGKWVMPGLIDAHVHLPGGRFGRGRNCRRRDDGQIKIPAASAGSRRPAYRRRPVSRSQGSGPESPYTQLL